MTTRVIAVMNQKGGVGKTTTAVNLGHALAHSGQRVTILDLDPQGQVAVSLGFDNQRPGMDAVLLHGAALDDVTIEARRNLRIVVAGNRLGDFEQRAEGGIERGHRLRKALDASSSRQGDLVLIDCPPSSGLLGVNALFSAREVIVPVAADYLSLQGLSRMMKILKQAEKLAGHGIDLWLVSTRVQLRRKLTGEVRNRLLTYFPGCVFPTLIRETVALAECPSFGKSILDYKMNSAGAEDYLSLAMDVVDRRTEHG